jgi:hypothetical protein
MLVERERFKWLTNNKLYVYLPKTRRFQRLAKPFVPYGTL